MNHSTVFKNPFSCPLRLWSAACIFMSGMEHADHFSRYAVINQYGQLLLFNLIKPLADKVGPQGIM